MLTYEVHLDRLDARGGTARCKDAEVVVDSDPAGRRDAFNPAELLLAALGACMLKNIERVAPILKFKFESVHIAIHGERQDAPPRMEHMSYRITIATDENDRRLALLHRNLRDFGTVFNTLASSVRIDGDIERASSRAPTLPSDPS